MKTHQRFTNWFFLTVGFIGVTEYWEKRLSRTHDLSFEISRFLDFYEVTDEKTRVRFRSLREIICRRLKSSLDCTRETFESDPDPALIFLKNLSDLQLKSKKMGISIITDVVFEEIISLQGVVYGHILKSLEEVEQISGNQIFFLAHYSHEDDLDGLLVLLAATHNWDPVEVATEAINCIIEGNTINQGSIISVFQTNKTLIGHPRIHERLSGVVEKSMSTHHPCAIVLDFYSCLRRTLP